MPREFCFFFLRSPKWKESFLLAQLFSCSVMCIYPSCCSLPFFLSIFFCFSNCLIMSQLNSTENIKIMCVRMRTTSHTYYDGNCLCIMRHAYEDTSEDLWDSWEESHPSPSLHASHLPDSSPLPPYPPRDLLGGGFAQLSPLPAFSVCLPSWSPSHSWGLLWREDSRRAAEAPFPTHLPLVLPP